MSAARPNHKGGGVDDGDPDVLHAFVAFVAEHRRCGDLDGGKDNGYVWLQCSCGGLLMQPEKEPPARTVRPDP